MGTLLGITGPIGSGKSTLAHLFADTEPSSSIYEVSYLLSEIGDHFNIALKGELALNDEQSDISLANQAMIWFAETVCEELHFNVTWNQLAIVKTHTAAHPELYEKLFEYLKSVRKQPRLLDQRITPENKPKYRTLLQWLGTYLPKKTSATIFFEELLRRTSLHDGDKKLIIIPSIRYVTDATFINHHGGLVIEIERPNLAEQDADDPTEHERRLIKPDIVLKNSGDLRQLGLAVETIWNDICMGTHKKTYDACQIAIASSQ